MKLVTLENRTFIVKFKEDKISLIYERIQDEKGKHKNNKLYSAVEYEKRRARVPQFQRREKKENSLMRRVMAMATEQNK